MKTRIWAVGIAGLLALAGTAEAQNKSRIGFGKPVGSFRQTTKAPAGNRGGSASRPSGGGAGRAPAAAPSRIGFGGSGTVSGRNNAGPRGGTINRGGSQQHNSGRGNGARGGGTINRGGSQLHNWGGRGGDHRGGSRSSVSISIGAGFGSFGHDYCPPVRRPVIIDRCDPIIVRRPVIIDRCEDPFIVRPPLVVCPPPVVVERPVVIVDDTPDVVTVYGEPAAPEYITQEEWCWRALADGNPDAMERFGDLVADDDMTGTAALGYAICAAAAGQIERADWAASQALQVDAEIARKVPRLPGLKDQIVSALKNYESLATERTPQRAQTVSLLKEAAGDYEGAQSAADAVVKLREVAARNAAAAVGLASAK